MYRLSLCHDHSSLDLSGCIYLQESITKGSHAFLNQQLAIHCAGNEDQVGSMEAQGDKRNQAVTAQDYQQQFPPPPVPLSFPRRVCNFCWWCISTSQSLNIFLQTWLKPSTQSLPLLTSVAHSFLTHSCLLFPQWPHSTGFNVAHEHQGLCFFPKHCSFYIQQPPHMLIPARLVSSRRVTTSPICHELHFKIRWPYMIWWHTELAEVVYDQSFALYLNPCAFTDRCV